MDIQNFIGLGVAGNFAGHLEQAGEAADFTHVHTEEESQPKAIFPFYVPSATLNPIEQFLSTYPLSHDTIHYTQEADNLQIEPEMALICDVIYENNKVVSLKPTHFAAFNDCSIRRPNARKISEKKNWGHASKGISSTQIAIDNIDEGSLIDNYHIACFLKRNGELNAYGMNSPVVEYSYFHQKLLNWIVDRMNNQPDHGPMNDIASLLKQANYPTKTIIAVGATRYTPFGDSHYLRAGDTSIVIVYDGTKYSHEQIVAMAEKEAFADDISALVQAVR